MNQSPKSFLGSATLSDIALMLISGTISAALPIAMFAALQAFASPAEVMIIRHGEKPPSGNHLDERGYERANALVPFFETNPSVLEFGSPVAIYACGPKDDTKSFRAIETVQPLADALRITIDSEYAKKKYDKMIKDVMENPQYEGRAVLVSWEHKMIPEMVQDFGWKNGPNKWDDSVFDRVWILKFKGDHVESFVDVPQHVLPGDSAR